MSHLLCQALRRVVVAGDDGELWSSRRTKRALDVVHVICDQVKDDQRHELVSLPIDEIARRSQRRRRSVQLGIADAVAAQLIWRHDTERPHGSRAVNDSKCMAVFSCLIHPALVAASDEKKPGRKKAPKLTFPRAWLAETADHPPQTNEKRKVLNMSDVQDDGCVRRALNARKKVVATPLAPPVHLELGTSGGLSAPQGRRVPAPAGRGPVAPLDLEVFFKVAANSEAFGSKFWAWLASSCAETGWNGELGYVGQRRRMSDGERGGRVPLTIRPLAEAAAASRHALRMAAARRGLEVTFEVVNELHPLLLVDDLGSNQRALLPTAGVGLIETSPENFQATLIAPRPLTRDERVRAQRALAARLGGDPAAVSASQLRRLPGSINGKWSLTEPFVSRLAADPVVGAISPEFLDELLLFVSPGAEVVATPEVNRRTVGGMTESQREFGWAIDQLRRAGGLRGDALRASIAQRAMARGKYLGQRDRQDAVDEYASLTVYNAEQRLGRPPSGPRPGAADRRS